MKANLLRLVLFVALMGGFYALEGFDRPVIERVGYRGQAKMTRAWMATVALFVGGARAGGLGQPDCGPGGLAYSSGPLSIDRNPAARGGVCVDVNGA